MNVPLMKFPRVQLSQSPRKSGESARHLRKAYRVNKGGYVHPLGQLRHRLISAREHSRNHWQWDDNIRAWVSKDSALTVGSLLTRSDVIVPASRFVDVSLVKRWWHIYLFFVFC